MTIVVVYGTQRRETTYRMTRLVLDRLCREDDRLVEFTLPRDLPQFCVGCGACFADYRACPHFGKTGPMREALEEADVVILATPVYVLHASGQMKAFLDHFGHQFAVHRPIGRLYRSRGLVIAQAAGGGAGSAAKDMRDSLLFWGVGRRYTWKASVYAAGWDAIAPDRRRRLEREADRLAGKLRREQGPDFLASVIFAVGKMMQTKWAVNEPDVRYWREMGWLDGGKPWKRRD